MLKKMNWNWKKTTLLTIVLFFIAIRIALPYIVTQYVNTVLADLDGYKGRIEDVDIWLIRGAYVIKGLQIDKNEGKVPVPFVKCEAIDLSVEWKALLHMKVKAEVELNKLVLNFVSGPSKEESQSGKDADWTEALDKLLPIEVNRFAITDGTITYKDFHSTPKVDMYLNDLQLLVTNLSNVKDENVKLPSFLFLTSSSIGKGNLSITGKLNVLKKMPDADLKLKFTDVDLTALNEFSKAYGKFDFERGQLSLFSEMAMMDGKIDGYVKPLMTNVKVLNWSEEDPGLSKIWQAIVGGVITVLKNQPKDQFATKVEIHGNVSNTKTDVWGAVINILKNGFIEAFQKSFESDEGTEEDKDKSKKEKRKERREERKKEREEKKDKE